VYDIHNHVLPGVDDGADGVRTSLRMIEQAILQGITHICCTPHATDRSGVESEKLFFQRFVDLMKAVMQAQLPVELGLAAEIMFGSDLQRALDYSFASYNGKGQYFLVEFSRETPFEIILNVIKASRRWGKTPCVAHVERYKQVSHDVARLQKIKAEGAVITMDAGSLSGQFGRKLIPIAKTLVQSNCIDILCSDAHNTEDHGFCLKTGYEEAASLIGLVPARRLVLDNPRIVWEGQPWPEQPPVILMKKPK
jgi:protein-tyrosine phosphatase